MCEDFSKLGRWNNVYLHRIVLKVLFFISRDFIKFLHVTAKIETVKPVFLKLLENGLSYLPEIFTT